MEGQDWTNKGMFPWNSIIKDSLRELPPDYSAHISTFVRHLLVCPRLQTVSNMQAECWRHSLCLTSRVHAGNPTFFRSLTRITPCFCKRLSFLAESVPKIHFMEFPFKVPNKWRPSSLWKTKWKYFSIAHVDVSTFRTNIYYQDNFVHTRELDPLPMKKWKLKNKSCTSMWVVVKNKWFEKKT